MNALIEGALLARQNAHRYRAAAREWDCRNAIAAAEFRASALDCYDRAHWYVWRARLLKGKRHVAA